MKLKPTTKLNCIVLKHPTMDVVYHSTDMNVEVQEYIENSGNTCDFLLDVDFKFKREKGGFYMYVCDTGGIVTLEKLK